MPVPLELPVVLCDVHKSNHPIQNPCISHAHPLTRDSILKKGTTTKYLRSEIFKAVVEGCVLYQLVKQEQAVLSM
jgi:hypothetical protein